MEQLTAHLPTKSAKIRALNNAGYSRSKIADFLGIRYQHVRNVLVNDARVAGASTDESPPSSAAGPGGMPGPTNVRMGPDGRIVIPSAFREALGLKKDETLLASLDNGEIRLMTIPAAIRKAQAIVRKFVPEGVSLVDELLADRRREAEREDRNG
jgi:bifunctional DNA-binding transcriptional regulator/antitoxin component of YhaV-PrlF toxin-antitoxin module